MQKITYGFAAALVVLGAGSYLMTGMRSATALIPAVAGILLAVCAAIAANPNLRKHAMHAAVLIAVLGLAGSVPGVIKLVQLASVGEKTLTAEQRVAAGLKDDQIMLKNEKSMRPVAAKVQAAMAGILAVYIGLCVKSFVDARRKRG